MTTKRTPTPYDERIADPYLPASTKKKLRAQAEGYRQATVDMQEKRLALVKALIGLQTEIHAIRCAGTNLHNLHYPECSRATATLEAARKAGI